MQEGSLLSTSSPTLVPCVFDSSCSDRCEVISCSFDLHFPDDQWCWASLHMSVGYLYAFFEEMSACVFCLFLIVLFVFWVLSCISSLHILDTNPLSNKSLANNFSHSVGCLLVLLIVSFAVQKFFMCVVPIVFLLFPFLQETYSRKMLWWQMAERLLSVLSFRILWFRVSHLAL